MLVSDASTGELQAVLDAASVTALRTGAAAVLAAETLGRADAETAAVIGAGVNGRAAARTFLARGRSVALWDVDPARAAQVASELGCAGRRVARGGARGRPARDGDARGTRSCWRTAALQPGQHVSLMGADGPGKAEVAGPELARARLFCDDWEQASHGGELAHAVEAGLVAEEDVTAIGAVLAGTAPGRASDDEITMFDSTGLAIQDLAIALAALDGADRRGPAAARALAHRHHHPVQPVRLHDDAGQLELRQRRRDDARGQPGLPDELVDRGRRVGDGRTDGFEPRFERRRSQP